MRNKKRTRSRRQFLRTVGAAGVLAPTMGLSGVMSAIGSSAGIHQSARVLPPVNVSAERVTQTIAGLRPYRPQGFRLDVQKLNDKTVVHNYGHGGGGVSLSWGTATLAIEQVHADSSDNIAVLGCGVIGLSTGLLLQRAGYNVTIYAKSLPPRTTSNIAAAFWAPVSVYEDEFVDGTFIKAFNRASRISQRMFQDLVGAQYGVWWITNYLIGGEFDFAGGADLYPSFRKLDAKSSPFNGTTAEEFSSLMIEPPVYLNALMNDFQQSDGKIVIRDFRSTSELMALDENVLMNCTGLGSNELFDDDTLIPVKGQLSVLLPQDEIEYSYIDLSDNALLYMFPRKDGIILGGTMEKGNWSLETDPEESKRVIDGHRRIADSLRA